MGQKTKQKKTQKTHTEYLLNYTAVQIYVCFWTRTKYNEVSLIDFDFHGVPIILVDTLCLISHSILYISALCRIQILYHVPMERTVGNQDWETLQTALYVRWECTASLINPTNNQLLNQWVFFTPFSSSSNKIYYCIKEAALILFFYPSSSAITIQHWQASSFPTNNPTIFNET